MTGSGCDVGIASPIVLDALTRWVNLQFLCVCMCIVCIHTYSSLSLSLSLSRSRSLSRFLSRSLYGV